MSVDADPFDGGKIPTVFSDAKTLSREIITVFCYGNKFKNQAVYCRMPPATAWQSTSKQSHRAYYHSKQEFPFTNAEVLC